MFVVYSRVSTGQQVTEGTSLEGQIERGIAKAKGLGAKDNQIKIYKEEGYSGEDIDIRPEMTRLREDVAKGLITHVIVQHPDRLSRDMTDKLIICRELEKNGAELIFTDTEFNKTPEGILFFNIISAIAAYELALIKKRTIRGRLNKVEKDKKIMPMRIAPYGYDLVNGQLIINEVEAGFVRKIYDWYVYDNLTMREIGEKLYQLGAIPKRKESKNWNASSIRRILTSEIHIGKYYYNRRKTSKVKGQKTLSGKQKKTYEFRVEEDWLLVNIPAIIDISLFNLAQAQKVKNTKKAGNNKYEYLLKGLIKCSCGRTWESTAFLGRAEKETGKKKKYLVYRCPNNAPRKYGPNIKKCEAHSIKTEEFEEYIWELVIKVLSNPVDYRAEINKSDSIEIIIEQLEAKQKQLQAIEKQKDKIKYLYIEDLITKDEMQKDMKRVNAEITKISEDIERDQTRLSIFKAKELSEERIYEMIDNAKQLLCTDKLSFLDKKNIINKLIDEIHVDFEDDNVKIKIIGALDDMFDDIGSNLQSQKV